jgi:hypothetical protein
MNSNFKKDKIVQNKFKIDPTLLDIESFEKMITESY